MNPTSSRFAHPPAARWAVALAFTLVYLSWGTTYLAIREGVHTYQLPPCLFGGLRYCLAGFLVLLYLRLRGESLSLPRGELAAASLAALLLFVGGNGFISVAMDSVPSSVAAVLVASTPLWMALMETFWPRGERLTGSGWLGLAIGMGGILTIWGPKLENPRALFENAGPFLILCSTLSWASGSLVLRHRKKTRNHLAAAAYQMVLGGSVLTLVGLSLGEGQRLTPDKFTAGAVVSFVYLLIVGSLVGFIAFNWLLGHVSAALVGTYAYVNPLVAILVGWLIGGEELTAPILGGMVIILIGVALVRGVGAKAFIRKQLREPKCREAAAEAT